MTPKFEEMDLTVSIVVHGKRSDDIEAHFDRRLGFADADKRNKVQSNNVLRDWMMTIARDWERWGARVEEKLGLAKGDFTSLCKG